MSYPEKRLEEILELLRHAGSFLFTLEQYKVYYRQITLRTKASKKAFISLVNENQAFRILITEMLQDETLDDEVIDVMKKIDPVNF